MTEKKATIKVKSVEDNADGSATVTIEVNEEAARLLFEKAFVTLLEEYIEEHK